MGFGEYSLQNIKSSIMVSVILTFFVNKDQNVCPVSSSVRYKGHFSPASIYYMFAMEERSRYVSKENLDFLDPRPDLKEVWGRVKCARGHSFFHLVSEDEVPGRMLSSDFMGGPPTRPALKPLSEKEPAPWKKRDGSLDFVEEVKLVASFFSAVTTLIL